MPKNPPADTPRVTPYLYYQDVATALRFLADAFGFREKLRMPGADGKIAHAEMTLGDGLVMMGCPGADYRTRGAPLVLRDARARRGAGGPEGTVLTMGSENGETAGPRP
jgi:uncharacterized glyoxalase superfamily protein PhnB